MASSPRVLTSRKATNSSNQLPAGPAAGSASASALCPQCLSLQSTFYCIACHSERLVWQHANQRRLQEERQKVKIRVEERLGLYQISEKPINNDLRDPFGEQYNEEGRRRKSSSATLSPHQGASHVDRMARATIARLQTDIEKNGEESHGRRKVALEGKRMLSQKRQDLARRRNLLETAQMSLHGFVATEEQEKMVSSHEKVAGLKQMIQDLQAESKQVADEVAVARARLARQAYSLFNVRAPSSSSLTNAQTRPDHSKGASCAGRSQRSKERYTAGAFAIDFTSAFDLGRSFREAKPKEEIGWDTLGQRGRDCQLLPQRGL